MSWDPEAPVGHLGLMRALEINCVAMARCMQQEQQGRAKLRIAKNTNKLNSLSASVERERDTRGCGSGQTCVCLTYGGASGNVDS